MKKFPFSLQTLFKIQHEKELKAHKELAEIELHLQKMIQEHQKLCQELGQIQKYFAERQQSSLTARELTQTIEYGSLLKQKIIQQQKQVNKTSKSLDDQRQQLVKIRQKQKVIENLQQKKEAEWTKNIQKNEKALLDEWVTLHHGRKTR